MDRINTFGCEFEVWRKRHHDKVVSISIWKSSPGYLFNISTGILWWVANIGKLYPGFGIRFYIDKNVQRAFSSSSKRSKDINWDMIFDAIKKNHRCELWLYQSQLGAKTVTKAKSASASVKKHMGTFGSFVRFHPIFDPSVEITCCKNVELLTTKLEAKKVKEWIAGGKKALMFIMGYKCDKNGDMGIGYYNICSENKKLIGKTMIPAGLFSYRGTPDKKKERLLFNKLIPTSRKHRFVYGFDEYILSTLFGEYLWNYEMAECYKLTYLSDFINMIDDFDYIYYYRVMYRYKDRLKNGMLCNFTNLGTKTDLDWIFSKNYRKLNEKYDIEMPVFECALPEINNAVYKKYSKPLKSIQESKDDSQLFESIRKAICALNKANKYVNDNTVIKHMYPTVKQYKDVRNKIKEIPNFIKVFDTAIAETVLMSNLIIVGFGIKEKDFNIDTYNKFLPGVKHLLLGKTIYSSKHVSVGSKRTGRSSSSTSYSKYERNGSSKDIHSSAYYKMEKDIDRRNEKMFNLGLRPSESVS